MLAPEALGQSPVVDFEEEIAEVQVFGDALRTGMIDAAFDCNTGRAIERVEPVVLAALIDVVRSGA